MKTVWKKINILFPSSNILRDMQYVNKTLIIFQLIFGIWDINLQQLVMSKHKQYLHRIPPRRMVKTQGQNTGFETT